MTARHPFPVRLRQAADALRTDQVLTAAQLQRYYDLTPEEIDRHFSCRRTMFRPLGNTSKVETTTFCMLDFHDLLWIPSWQLSHLASTAELRHLLRIPRADWVLEGGEGEAQRPDALATLQEYRLAVEHDAGYARTRVREKLDAFKAYDYTVWGTLSRARKSHLEARYSDRVLFVHTDITSPERPAHPLDLTQTILAQLARAPVAGARALAAQPDIALPAPPAG